MATNPSPIGTWAASELADLASASAAVSNIGAGIVVLDGIITGFQNSPGTLSPADQASLDAAQAASKALLAQLSAISTTPPGTTVPVIPIPPPPPGVPTA